MTIANVDIYEITCCQCGYVFRLTNDDRQDLYEEHCPNCNEMLPCDNPDVKARMLCTISIDLNSLEVIETTKIQEA